MRWQKGFSDKVQQCVSFGIMTGWILINVFANIIKRKRRKVAKMVLNVRDHAVKNLPKITKSNGINMKTKMSHKLWGYWLETLQSMCKCTINVGIIFFQVFLNLLIIYRNQLINCAKQLRCAVRVVRWRNSGLANPIVPLFPSIAVQINPNIGACLKGWYPQKKEEKSFWGC